MTLSSLRRVRCSARRLSITMIDFGSLSSLGRLVSIHPCAGVSSRIQATGSAMSRRPPEWTFRMPKETESSEGGRMGSASTTSGCTGCRLANGERYSPDRLCGVVW